MLVRVNVSNYCLTRLTLLFLGGARRARRIAKYMGMKIALLENRIENGVRVMNVVGQIEENAVIVDDMIDTGESVMRAWSRVLVGYSLADRQSIDHLRGDSQEARGLTRVRLRHARRALGRYDEIAGQYGEC